jgi:integrase
MTLGDNPSMKLKITINNLKNLTPQEKPYEVFDTEVKGFLFRIEPSGVMTYYLAYKNTEGKRRRYRLGRHGNITVAQARKLAEQKAGLVANGQDIQAIRVTARQTEEQSKYHTLEGFLEEKYGPWVEQSRKTGTATLSRIEANFSHLNKTPLSEITPWQIDKWRTEQLKEGKRKATINRDISALRATLSKALEWGIIQRHPLEKVKPLKIDQQKKVRYLSPDEETRLRVALRNRDTEIKQTRESANTWRKERGYSLYPSLIDNNYADHLEPMVLLSINTGLRRGEVFNLKWNDVDLKKRILTVAGETSKSYQTRHIPLNIEATDVLKKWADQSTTKGYVFPGKEGKRLDNVKKSWQSLCEKAKISDFRWHDQRHHFASKLVMRGVPLNTVRELLGHSTMAITLRYAHLAPDHKADAVAMLDSK